MEPSKEKVNAARAAPRTRRQRPAGIIALAALLTLPSQYAAPQVDCTPNASADDPLYHCQWHLRNTGTNSSGTAGQDINVASVWQNYRGEGISIAVVDEGIDSNHEDLRDNARASLNHNYFGSQRSYYDQDLNHGTSVAGIIAARDRNRLGVRGVAPRAAIYGYNLLQGEEGFTTANVADAMTRNMAVTAVSNNSWGPSFPLATAGGRIWEMAVERGLTLGFNGKGTVYVFAAGNDGAFGDNANYDGNANHYAIMAVCAVNDRGVRSTYSEMGANLWLCAPSDDPTASSQGITTTDNENEYAHDFGGTSAAAPIVAGVVALVRQANPNLTWRDVKLILAASARKNNAGHSDWTAGALEYGSSSQRYEFNHGYGFGVVDAQAAVNLARNWRLVPPMKTVERSGAMQAQAIPDGSPAGITTSFTITSDINFVEFVEIGISVQHQFFGDMKMRMTSPAGTVSQLIVPSTQNDFIVGPTDGRLGSAKHLGENPSGTWSLTITDETPENTGTINSLRIKIYGHTTTSSPTSPLHAAATGLTEQNLDGATIALTLRGATWADGLTARNFSLSGAPAGVGVLRATRISSTRTALNLRFDGTDFDENKSLIVQAMQAAHDQRTTLRSNAVGITANREATGDVSVTGRRQVGRTLAASVANVRDADGLSNPQYAWQWQVMTGGTWTNIAGGANGVSLTLARQQQGLRVRPVVSFMDAIGNKESLTVSDSSVVRVEPPPALNVEAPVSLTEANLNNAVLTMKLSGGQWTAAANAGHFSLSGAPTGLLLAGGERRSTSTDVFGISLRFDGTDFDDNRRLRVRALAAAVAEYTGDDLVAANTIEIDANRNPVLAQSVLAPQAGVGGTYRFAVPPASFTDPDGDALTYTLRGLPAGFSFGASSPTVISGTPASTANAVITMEATDTGGESATTEFVLTVMPAGYPLAVNPPRVQTVTVRTAFTYDVVANQVFLDPEGSSLAYAVANLPGWLRFNSTAAVFTGTPGVRDVGELNLNLTATDTDGNTGSVPFNIVVRSEQVKMRLRVFLEGPLR